MSFLSMGKLLQVSQSSMNHLLSQLKVFKKSLNITTFENPPLPELCVSQDPV